MAKDSAVSYVRISPSIGIARVGNSTFDKQGEGWYIGPEIPSRGVDLTNDGTFTFKDPEHGVKRQAVRFRLFAYNAQDEVLFEVTEDRIDWSIEVANKKASWYAFMGKDDAGTFESGYRTLRNPNVQPEVDPDARDKLIISSGLHSLSGPSAERISLQGHFNGSRKAEDHPEPVYLGAAETDEFGRLVVLAGRGRSESIADPDQPVPLLMTDFDSPDWFDDTCDGIVDASVVIGGQTFQALHQARVIGTTPKFADEILAPTTLYDVMENIWEEQKREKQGENYKVDKPDWYRHIWPLLERPVKLGWVNGQAFGGHGPGGPAHFSSDDWQKVLKGAGPEADAARKNVLGRMRLPETNSGKYDKARAGQAYPYFMPWLSGDGGRTTAGNVGTFTAITELQHDRLSEWAAGNFTVESPPSVPSCFEDIPLAQQPDALTKAQLENTIGAPLYPGIEMSWNAELPSTYDTTIPFTISKTQKAGDLTKFLSLPWQSDFYMCRNYWWPSARPDAVIPFDALEDTEKLHPADDVPKALGEQRLPWERGLHQNYTDAYPDQPLFANTDMVKHWHDLGFIVKYPLLDGQSVYVETQRNLERNTPQALHREVDHSKSRGPIGGKIGLPSPTKDPNAPITTLESLREHLRIAMAIELTTIPLYLAALYSIKLPSAQTNNPRYYDPIMSALRGVVAEEMLHLSLAGNILLAIGGEFQVYDPNYIPVYPANMLGHTPDLPLSLSALTMKQLDVFLRVEKPETVHAKAQSGKYHTLGQFYMAIEKGLEYLTTKPDPDRPILFDPTTAAKQFSPGIGYQPHVHDAGGSVVVTDLETAKQAIRIIVDQGEGESMPSGDPSDYVDPSQDELSHSATFKKLRDGESQSWQTWPITPNPKTQKYAKIDRKIYQVSVTFDAAYCFLLKTIDKIWELDTTDERRKMVFGNLYGVMIGVLKPLALFMVSQPLGSTGNTACPCFGYYHFKTSVSALKQLKQEMQSTIDAYCKPTAENADQVVVENLGAQLETLLPIQQTIGNLLELETLQRKGPSVPMKKPLNVLNRGAKGFATGA